MRSLSISAAWDETKAVLARDGRLLFSVALALVALPTAIAGIVNPGGVNNAQTPLWIDLVTLIASLVALAGQLALIRLALGPSITVGSAIGHGLRRMPFYFLAVLMIVFGLLLIAVPMLFILAALGVPIDRTPIPVSAPLVLIGLIYFALICFVGVRMMMSAPAASAEAIGPIDILKRSWQLTDGHWWALFGFIAIFFVGAIVLLLAVGSAAGVLVGLTFGTIQPMSIAALIVALVQALVNAVVTTLFALMLARIYAQLAGRDEVRASVPGTSA